MQGMAADEALCTQAALRTQVALATLALLSYRLLFCSARELNLIALLFCAACAWCTGQLAEMVHVGAGVRSGLLDPLGGMSPLSAPGDALAGMAAAAGSAVRAVCAHVGLSEAARDACWNYTQFLMPVEH